MLFVKTSTLIVLLVLSCAPTHASISGCSWTCVSDGLGATAPHCGQRIFRAPECGHVSIRQAVEGEVVEVRAIRGAYRCAVLDPNWMHFVQLDCIGSPGDSGSGVFGEDGALLGVVDRNVDGTLLAMIL